MTTTLALLSGVVACTSTAENTIEPAAQPAVELLRTTAFPPRYRFTYQPVRMALLDCLAGPNPDLEGTVDTLGEAMEIHVVERPEQRATVIGGLAYIKRTLIPDWPDPGTEWVAASRADTAADSSRLQRRMGPGIASFVIPPRLPNDPNTTIQTTLEVAASVSHIGVEVIDGVTTSHLRIAADTGRMTDAIRSVTPASSTNDADATTPLVDAWVDDKGRVVQYDVAELLPGSGPPARNPSKPGYRMKFSFDEAPDVTAPDPATVLALANFEPSTSPGTSIPDDCTVTVGG